MMKYMTRTLGMVLALGALLVVMNKFAPDRKEAKLVEAQKEQAEKLEQAKEEAINERYKISNLALATQREEDAKAKEAAPPPPPVKSVFRVKLETTKGDIVIECHPEWAPLGAARMREAVEAGIYDDAAFFRVIEGFMVQFGIPGDPAVAAEWSEKMIKRDPVYASNTRGMVTFAQSSGNLNSRTTQLFINFSDRNAQLDRSGFSPIGVVVEGMDVVDSINSEYVERPNQAEIQQMGNEYLRKNFPNLDYIKKATIVAE